ncbi:hypothetical protein, partial [Neoroseomonas lacus]|uniref:hypothetical protein n=1 Tax=Neoroseomonas lacus TaxID=287609 RepID=UPI001E2B4E01
MFATDQRSLLGVEQMRWAAGQGAMPRMRRWYWREASTGSSVVIVSSVIVIGPSSPAPAVRQRALLHRRRTGAVVGRKRHGP